MGVNADFSSKNKLRALGSILLTAQQSCPISAGDFGVWLDGTISPAVFKLRNQDGTDNVLGEDISGMSLHVGTPSGYAGANASWMVIDGVNPPSFPKIRLWDQATASWKVGTLSNGVLTWA